MHFVFQWYFLLLALKVHVFKLKCKGNPWGILIHSSTMYSVNNCELNISLLSIWQNPSNAGTILAVEFCQNSTIHAYIRRKFKSSNTVACNFGWFWIRVLLWSMRTFMKVLFVMFPWRTTRQYRDLCYAPLFRAVGGPLMYDLSRCIWHMRILS